MCRRRETEIREYKKKKKRKGKDNENKGGGMRKLVKKGEENIGQKCRSLEREKKKVEREQRNVEVQSKEKLI